MCLNVISSEADVWCNINFRKTLAFFKLFDIRVVYDNDFSRSNSKTFPMEETLFRKYMTKGNITFQDSEITFQSFT